MRRPRWRIFRSVRWLVAGVASSATMACGYTWGIEHVPLVDGPGPRSTWIRVASSGAPYDVDLHLPPADRVGSRAAPLVIVLHGYGGTGPGMERRTRFSELADSVGFVVAYPNAHANAQGRRAWMGSDSGSADVTMLRALIDSVGVRVRLDRTRVYLAGFSNGGGMTYRAAQAMPELFAAIGAVAATNTVPRSGHLARGVPLFAVHGMTDRTVPFEGREPGLSTPATVRAWAQRNGCALPATVDTMEGGRFIRTTYTSCPESADAVLYAMREGGHGWPTLHTREAPFPTTQAMWRFLGAHSLLRAPRGSDSSVVR